MDGLSPTHRRIYLWVLTGVFVVLSPLLVLYASGYRLADNFAIVETGGVYVQVGESGAELYLDGEYVGRGSLFQKSFFEQNLVPDTYAVSVEKTSHYTWEKTLTVYPRRVAEGQALLVATEPTYTRLVPERVALQNAVSTTTETVPQRQYATIQQAFTEADATAGFRLPQEAATTSITWRGATTTVAVRGNIGMWYGSSTLYARWLGESDETPYQFCQGTACSNTLSVYREAPRLTHAAFIPGSQSFLLLERPDGVFVTELDTRPPHNTFPIFAKAGAQVRVVDERIIVRTADGELFAVTY